MLIPRNHQIEAMIQSAVAGDYSKVHRLNTAYATPYDMDAEYSDLTHPPKPDEVVQATFCGT